MSNYGSCRTDSNTKSEALIMGTATGSILSDALGEGRWRGSACSWWHQGTWGRCRPAFDRRSISTSLRWRGRATTTHNRSATYVICWLQTSQRRLHVACRLPWSTTATLCSTALHPAPSASCGEYRTTPQGSFNKRQDDHTRTRCWTHCIGCQWSSASSSCWPCWRSRYSKRQHQRISVGTSGHRALLLGYYYYY